MPFTKDSRRLLFALLLAGLVYIILYMAAPLLAPWHAKYIAASRTEAAAANKVDPELQAWLDGYYQWPFVPLTPWEHVGCRWLPTWETSPVPVYITPTGELAALSRTVPVHITYADDPNALLAILAWVEGQGLPLNQVVSPAVRPDLPTRTLSVRVPVKGIESLTAMSHVVEVRLLEWECY